jgi:threonine synthase
MDVGNPSNFSRILDLFDGDFERVREVIAGYAFTDEETRSAMRQVFANNGYVMDPHGAVAYLGLKEYLQESNPDAIGVFAETAHPAKFHEVVQETLASRIIIPEKLLKFMSLSKKVVSMPASYEHFRRILVEKLG